MQNSVQEQEATINKQMRIKELLKQAFKNKIHSVVNQTVSELWFYTEKPKMQKTWDSKGRKLIKRQPSSDPYTIEFPDEDQDIEDIAHDQNRDEVHDEELAQKTSYNLQIKRKREDDCQMLLEDEIEDVPNINRMQIVLKRQKGNTAEHMTEEAGPSMPPTKP
ncbi:hypothetical protein PIB30_087447 [Stylosanthes scabra]|uniref:Uncharacterized protein n=1 Tax=Stylosanthes scabra TaxID=79078 RepID=A0ABU6TSZ7_9FABA|nr:hypothetical protein [Stylosanthes scabra]